MSSFTVLFIVMILIGVPIILLLHKYEKLRFEYVFYTAFAVCMIAFLIINRNNFKPDEPKEFKFRVLEFIADFIQNFIDNFIG